MVDNGSTDHTQDVLARVLETSTTLTQLLVEPKVGKSYALNLGIQYANGEYLLFTDDDALVTPQWLPEMVRAFRSNDSIGILGGRTQSVDSDQIKQGVRDSVESKEYYWPSSSAFVVGNNMGVSRTALEAVGGFDVYLGAGSRVGGAEETDLAYRVLKAGYGGKYVPEALIYHDHRREDHEVHRIRWNYAKGRGAFFIKHILRGDTYVLKMAFWNTKAVVRNRNDTDSGVYRKDWKRLLLGEWVGAATWLARL